ncbi:MULTISPECIES: hypothetical protein [unclassified Facklamia]|uniref:hypothetical protein n=1 Tax=Aerococcaceae TaxID=186827 RepID=UPI0013BB8609|nr:MULTISPECIES: hypothetical protein [unclassified Facklamia]NEW64271.1 hypothetical protein [Facklamia sp. 252]NEW68786.1 hypothetical protein [Facklamia sp. 253]QQD64737.1 hypothetical protein JDW14_05205 [Aerococcaceae bacterium zg-252]
MIVAIICVTITEIFKHEQQPAPERDPLVEQITEANGKPVLVSTVKYGDDVKPHYAQTYCQLLPFKRHIEDNQIYCWTEVD